MSTSPRCGPSWPKSGLAVVADEPQPDWLRRHGVEPPPLEGRTDDGWRLARLFDETLPFRVLVAGRS